MAEKKSMTIGKGFDLMRISHSDAEVRAIIFISVHF